MLIKRMLPDDNAVRLREKGKVSFPRRRESSLELNTKPTELSELLFIRQKIPSFAGMTLGIRLNFYLKYLEVNVDKLEKMG